MRKIIQVGLAGFGMSGQVFQAPFIDANPNFSLKKVYERSTCLSKERYPYVEVVSDFSQLLTEEIDLVIISTPNALHYSMAKQALEAGKHVVVEKPMAITADEGQELCSLARHKNLVFTVYQNRRLDGDFLTVQKVIQDGLLGDILDVDIHYDRYVMEDSKKAWKAQGGKGVNILYDLGVHIIDQAYVLFGMPLEVYADVRKQRPGLAEFDYFDVILYYDLLKVRLSAGELVAKHGPRYRVNGRMGSFIKYGLDVQEEALIAGVKPVGDTWGLEDPEQYGHLYYRTDETTPITWHETIIPTLRGFYGRFYENLYDVLTEGSALLVQPEQAVDVLKIIHAAEKSQLEGRRIKIS